MRMRHGILAFLALVSCAKAPPPSSTTTTTEAPIVSATASAPAAAPSRSLGEGVQPLGDSPFTVVVPKGFELVPAKIDGFWDVEGPYEMIGVLPHRGPVAKIFLTRSVSKSASELTQRTCGKKPRGVVQATLPSGGLFVQCKGDAQLLGANVDTSQVHFELAAGSDGVECLYEADNPALIKYTADVCRSIRRR
jgi:hypothetical protein